MKTEVDPLKMMDLSFLSLEEQRAIQQVLKRDAELKALEERRIRKLKKSIFDPNKLKVLTGEWFNEAKSKRYGEFSSGIEIIKNSFNWKKKTSVDQETPVQIQKEAEALVNLSPRNLNLSAPLESTPPTSQDLKQKERQFTDLNLEPKAEVKQSLPNVQATPNREKEKPDAKTNEGDNLISAMNPYSNYEVSPKMFPSMQKNFPQDDLFFPTKHFTALDGSVMPIVSPEESKNPFVPLVPEQVKSVKHSPTSTDRNHVSKGSAPDLVNLQEFEEKSGQAKTSSLSMEDNLFDPKEKDLIPPADSNQKQAVSRQLLVSEILKDFHVPKEESPEPIMENSPKESVAIKSPELDDLFSSKSSDLKPETLAEASKKSSKLTVEDQQRDENMNPSLDLISNVTNPIKKSGNNYQSLPNLASGRAESELSKRKGILKRSPSTSSTESESRYRWAPNWSAEDLGALPQQTDDSNGFTKMDAPGKQVRFSNKVKTKSLDNMLGGRKPGATKTSSLRRSEEPTMPNEDNMDGNRGKSIPASLSPDSTQNSDPEQDKSSYLKDKTTPGDEPPASQGPQNKDQGPNDDRSNLKAKGSESPISQTASKAAIHSLLQPEPQREDPYYDYDTETSESSFGSDILKKNSVHIPTNLSDSKLSGSFLSLYSDAGDFGNVLIQGAIQFKLQYEEAKNEFQIQVAQCRGLSIANIKKSTSDPYVKTYLLPDRTQPSKRKTSVNKGTLNPVFDEILRYNINKQELFKRTLNVSVWHNDSLGRNVYLGETEVDMKNWDWKNSELEWYDLQSKTPDISEAVVNKGHFRVALKYVPAKSLDGNKPDSGEIHIWLKAAMELYPIKPGGVDSFVRCYILPDTSKRSCQKTQVLKKTFNPIYNHTMVYDGFKMNEIMEACVELSIWHHELFSNQFLGGIRLGVGTGFSYNRRADWMDSNEEEIALWNKMLYTPTKWVEADLPLRATMTKRK
eukprot:gi/632963393/ref/XP_007897854.1/ PREDICTED: synaptotagmin-like protein 1 isoform X2 [Callorhinchus milii]